MQIRLGRLRRWIQGRGFLPAMVFAAVWPWGVMAGQMIPPERPTTETRPVAAPASDAQPLSQANGNPLDPQQQIDSRIRDLQNPKKEIRRDAVKALGEIGNPRAMEPLLAVLLDPDWRHSRTAHQLVSELIADLRVGRVEGASVREPSPSATPPSTQGRAMRPFESNPEHTKHVLQNYFRAQTARLLGDIGDPRATKPLLAFLHEQPLFRNDAVYALVRIGVRAVEPLEANLADPDPSIRSLAADALGSIGDAGAIEPLLSVLTDPNAKVRHSAGEALERIDPYWPFGEAARRRVPELIGRLGGNDPRATRLAAEALGKIGGQLAIQPLTNLLQSQDRQTVSTAERALQAIRNLDSLTERRSKAFFDR